MAMRKSTAAELRMLRIIGFHFLTKHTCMLCSKALMQYSLEKETGGRVGKPIDEEFTEHHIDGNHENHSEANRAMVHRPCHKVFERKLVYYISKNVPQLKAEKLALADVRKQFNK